MAQQSNSAFNTPVLDDIVASGSNVGGKDDDYILGDLSGLLDEEENQHSLGDISSFAMEADEAGEDLGTDFTDFTDSGDEDIPLLTETVDLPQSSPTDNTEASSAMDDKTGDDENVDSEASLSDFLSQSVMPEEQQDAGTEAQTADEAVDPAAAFEAMLTAPDANSDEPGEPAISEDELTTAAASTATSDDDNELLEEELAALGLSGFNEKTEDSTSDDEIAADVDDALAAAAWDDIENNAAQPPQDAPDAQAFDNLNAEDDDVRNEVPEPDISDAELAEALAAAGTMEQAVDPDEGGTDTGSADSVAAAAAVTQPIPATDNDHIATLRGELHAQLAEKLDLIISDTVATLADELEAQLAIRVERLLVDSLESVLPKLMEQLILGIREEIHPRVKSQIPEIIEHILGRKA